jgi:hypothetical protein
MGIMNFLMSRKGMSDSQSGAGANARTNGSAHGTPNMGMRPAVMDTDSYLASDEKAWVKYLSQALRTYRKPGLSMQEEHKLWLAARTRDRAMATGAGVRGN